MIRYRTRQIIFFRPCGGKKAAPFPLKKGKEGRFGLKLVPSPFGLGVELR
jgi:hypothetical protein